VIAALLEAQRPVQYVPLGQAVDLQCGQIFIPAMPVPFRRGPGSHFAAIPRCVCAVFSTISEGTATPRHRRSWPLSRRSPYSTSSECGAPWSAEPGAHSNADCAHRGRGRAFSRHCIKATKRFQLDTTPAYTPTWSGTQESSHTRVGCSAARFQPRGSSRGSGH